MSFVLKEVQCSDAKCVSYLKKFCRKWASNHPKVGLNIPINVYVDSNGEFIAFDSPKYKIVFTNQNNKVADIKGAEKVQGDITLEEFYDYVIWI